MHTHMQAGVGERERERDGDRQTNRKAPLHFSKRVTVCQCWWGNKGIEKSHMKSAR